LVLVQAQTGLLARRRVFAVFEQLQNNRADFHAFGTCFDGNLADNTFIDALDFHCRFIRFNFGQYVTRGNAVAFFDKPFCERAFLHTAATRTSGTNMHIDSI